MRTSLEARFWEFIFETVVDEIFPNFCKLKKGWMYNIFVSSTHLQIARPILLSLGTWLTIRSMTTSHLIGGERELCVAVERKCCKAEIETVLKFNPVHKRRNYEARNCHRTRPRSRPLHISRQRLLTVPVIMSSFHENSLNIGIFVRDTEPGTYHWCLYMHHTGSTGKKYHTPIPFLLTQCHCLTSVLMGVML